MKSASFAMPKGAKCALHGETEGGADTWKDAWALACEVDETRSRKAALRKAIGGR